MAEELQITPSSDKNEKYETLLPQIKALVEGEPNLITNLANITAAIKSTFGFLWVGFYSVIGNELVLGPFQGSIACTRLQKGKGVCGKAWQKAETLVVDDVNQFEGHIFCNSFAKSEIVVPIFNKRGEVILVLDIDSEECATFDATDKFFLEVLAKHIQQIID